MNNQSNYVQMMISSTEEFSKQLVNILNSRNYTEFIDAISGDTYFWVEIFKSIETGDFSHLKEFESFKHKSNYSFVSLPTALKLIPNFTVGSVAYGTQEKQKKTLNLLLNSLSFLDCDLFLTLLFKKFRWAHVKKLLDKNRPKENKNGKEKNAE